MKKAVLLIDGENFQHKVEQVLDIEKINRDKLDVSEIQLNDLTNKVFKEHSTLKIIEKRYYCAKLHRYEETLEKSIELIETQRKLKVNLLKSGFKFVFAGNVRAQFINNKKTIRPIFREKGVDVRIAVDMVKIAYDKTADTIILCSSDSDLQPAVTEARSRGLEVIYLGFSQNPNKGLTYTTSETVLFRNPEIINAVTKVSK